MAKQLYDYWFVQFEFPNEEGKPYKSSGGAMVWNEKLHREIPRNWDVVTLSEYLNVYSEKISAINLDVNCKYAPIEVLPRRRMSFNECAPIENAVSGLCRFGKKQILLSNRRVYFHKVCIAAFDGVTRDTVIILSPVNKALLGYAYQIINDDVFIEYATRHSYGSEQPVLSWESAKIYKTLKPSNQLNVTYSKRISPIIDSVIRNELEIAKLTKQRDELLPLLMNGQVSVNSDLAVLYIIYKNINIRIMKENIIQAIVAEMQRDLDCRQMARLKAVLASELHNVEIVEKEDCSKQQAQENEHLLSSFISAKKIEGCSEKTLAYYRNTIERLLLTLSVAICHITTSDIRAYLSDYQEEHQSSKVTIDNMRRIFSSFFAWLEDEDYIAKSPVRRIHKVKTDSLVKEVLSDEQLEQLRDSCTNKRDLALIDILSSTGIRVGELVKLNREDIDFHERHCVVFGKGNKERVVYFNARTKLHLQQYLDERTDDNPALFVSLHSPHTRLTISGVEVRIRELGKSLSMPKVHPHKFRRTLATMAIDKGMPIEQVQRLLGHVRIDTTLHYAIVNQNNVKLAHKKYLG